MSHIKDVDNKATSLFDEIDRYYNGRKTSIPKRQYIDAKDKIQEALQVLLRIEGKNRKRVLSDESLNDINIEVMKLANGARDIIVLTKTDNGDALVEKITNKKYFLTALTKG